MTICTIDESQRKAARVVGFTCLFTMAIVVFANFGIHERLIVSGNVAETARNIVAHETLFRIGIACGLVYSAGLVVLLTALYVILKPVDRGLALLAAFWRLVYALMWVLRKPKDVTFEQAAITNTLDTSHPGEGGSRIQIMLMVTVTHLPVGIVVTSLMT